jgi:5-methylthioadenosine/S-adenosylhomocysteine deaminase
MGSGSTGRLALEGRVVTMDGSSTVVSEGVVYVQDHVIAAVRPAAAPAPGGFEDVDVIKTGGTIYPGLIELHNHLSYDVLPLWNVPKQFSNRDQWGSGGSNAREYRTLISGPMTILGKSSELSQAVVRYVECKALVGGVTTSQGVALFSNSGIPRYYRGVVRNVEQPLDKGLHLAHDRIGDVESKDAELFLATLQRSTCLLLHLSEGTDPAAREHFEALHLPDGSWAVAESLAGIHCVALSAADFKVLAEAKASMVWSPLSNLLLYGETAKIEAAKEKAVRMGIGSDWSPSGSKNLLGELKVAHLVSQARGHVFSDQDLVAMATRNAAAILTWDEHLGSIEETKYADLVVVAGRQGDPYAHLVEAKETDLELVVIDGVPRYGQPRLMEKFDLGAGTEALKVGSAARVINLQDDAADPVVSSLTLGEARVRLKNALANLHDLAVEMEHPSVGMALESMRTEEPRWFLQLDGDETAGFALRPHLPGPDGRPTAESPLDLTAASEPLSAILGPVELDALTVADDDGFLDLIAKEKNLPEPVRDGLKDLYR